MLEMRRRLTTSANAIHVLVPLSCIIAALWVGPWALLPLVAAAPLSAKPRLLPRMHDPGC
jgi:hypothetical protein